MNKRQLQHLLYIRNKKKIVAKRKEKKEKQIQSAKRYSLKNPDGACKATNDTRKITAKVHPGKLSLMMSISFLEVFIGERERDIYTYIYRVFAERISTFALSPRKG